MSNYETLIERAQSLHGEICPGVIMGTRMSMVAMEKLGMDPLEPNDDLMVSVEVDRCVPDAIQAITGCTVGRRTLKCLDYGKFVTTFIDVKTGKTIRISARDDKLKDVPGLWTWFENIAELAREKNMAKIMEEKKSAIGKLSGMSDDDLLLIEEFDGEVPLIPGLPKDIVVCSICGEHVMDGKQLQDNGEIICRSCENRSHE
nr:FmdE family protein [uncultured Methanobacterium sp.]